MRPRWPALVRLFILVLNSAGLKTIFKFQIMPQEKALSQLEESSSVFEPVLRSGDTCRDDNRRARRFEFATLATDSR